MATKKSTSDSLGYADAVTELEEILTELEADDVDVDRLAEQVRRSTTLNREIAERFTSMVADSLGLMTRLINQSNVYGASGGYLQRPATAVMINREA